jgi:hypothetical protein
MPVYAIKNLTRYNHLPPLKPQHCPHTLNPITYDKDNQATTPNNTSPLIDAAGKKQCCHMVQLVGGLLLEPFFSGLNSQVEDCFYNQLVESWDPTCPIIVHSGVDSRKVSKNHPTLMGLLTWNWASSPQLVPHEQSLFTLPITSRKWHMVTRQLKLLEQLIKLEPWCMQSACGLTV